MRGVALVLLCAGCGGFKPIADGGDDASVPDAGCPSFPCVVELATGRANSIALTVGNGMVYWADQGTAATVAHDGKIMQVPADGCRPGQADCPHTIADSQISPGGLALSVDGATLYWLELSDAAGTPASGKVWQIPLDGSMLASPFAQMQDGPRKIVTTLQTIYWINGNSGELRGKDVQFGSPNGAVLVPSLAGPVRLAVRQDTGALFWTEYGTNGSDGAVTTSDRFGMNGMVLATNRQSPRGVTAGTTFVYWAEAGAGAVMRAMPDGTMLGAVASDLLTPQDVAVDGLWIYWLEGGTQPNMLDGRVVARRLDGSDQRTIATDRHDPRYLAQDADWIYWVDGGDPTHDAYDGAVVKAAKPK
jgi:hypothetical protein